MILFRDARGFNDQPVRSGGEALLGDLDMVDHGPVCAEVSPLEGPESLDGIGSSDHDAGRDKARSQLSKELLHSGIACRKFTGS